MESQNHNELQRVLVTGADGFIGSHMVEFLLDMNISVRALCCYNSASSYGWLEQSRHRDNLEIILGDVRDPFLCKKICADVDVVINLAALIAIPYSYLSPSSYLETNIGGTLNLLEGVRDSTSIKKFVQISTSEVYGTAQYTPIDEKHPLRPQSPYSASKIGSDNLALSYYYTYDLPICVARPFNTYGPRQSARAFIPTIISQLYSEKSVIHVGDLSPTRNMNFVKDTCAGIYHLAKAENAVGKVVNVGSHNENSMLEIAQTIMRITSIEKELVSSKERKRPTASEVHRLVCDPSLFKEMTGYQHLVSLEDGIRETVTWFKSEQNLKLYKSDLYNV